MGMMGRRKEGWIRRKLREMWEEGKGHQVSLASTN